MIDPADTFTCVSGEPMIVGPITLLTWPICGPMNERAAPHDCDDVLPLLPPNEGLFVPTQPAVPIWLPPIAAPPVAGIGKPTGGS